MVVYTNRELVWFSWPGSIRKTEWGLVVFFFILLIKLATKLLPSFRKKGLKGIYNELICLCLTHSTFHEQKIIIVLEQSKFKHQELICPFG